MNIQQTRIRACKTVIIGESGAGKTSLATKFVNDRFDDFQESTIGAAFLTKKLDNVNYEIWDTAGQERYHSLAPMYYRGAKAAIIVFDVTSQRSYERGKTWVNEIQQNCRDDIVIIFVGNKIDKQPTVHRDDVEFYCIQQDIRYVETSAKDGTNIEKIFFPFRPFI